MNDKEKLMWHRVQARLTQANTSITKDLNMYEHTDITKASAIIILNDNIEELRQALIEYIDFYDENIKIKNID